MEDEMVFNENNRWGPDLDAAAFAHSAPRSRPMDEVTVTQADRDAASALHLKMYGDRLVGDPVAREMILAGKNDSHHFIQAFARHRLAALAYWKGEMMTGKPTAPDLAALSAAATLWPGLDHIANFINSLDSEGMTAKDVRTAIYTECLSPKHRSGNLVQIDREGMRERVVDALRMTSDLSIVECAEVAPAVIAAMMGGAK